MGDYPGQNDKRLEKFRAEALNEWLEFQKDCRSYSIWRGLLQCESPIESYMAIALGGMVLPGFEHFYFAETPCEFFPQKVADYKPSTPFVAIYPQSKIGDYRVDFLVVGFDLDYCTAPIAPRWKFLVVECDGHDFHEKTKEQAGRDKGRDRWLTANGYQVFRFTGSEIYRDPRRCSEQIEEVLSGLPAGAFDSSRKTQEKINRGEY